MIINLPTSKSFGMVTVSKMRVNYKVTVVFNPELGLPNQSLVYKTLELARSAAIGLSWLSQKKAEKAIGFGNKFEHVTTH